MDLDGDRLQQIQSLLAEAAASLQLLRRLAWPPEVRDRFLADECNALPEVHYPRFDPGPAQARVARARALLGTRDDAVARWLARQADAIESGALMLVTAGTDDFLRHSRAVFGAPDEAAPDGDTTALDLARETDALTASLGQTDLGEPPPARHTAEDLADRMRTTLAALFGDQAPPVQVVDGLSANVLAGPRTVRIRRQARFSDPDVSQLIEHEAGVHVLTSVNGQQQRALPLLATPHPGTTRTQEGLAVFAEVVSGRMEPERMQRLANRVLAIQMALDGADFIDVYRFFRARADDRQQAFEQAQRVFRGGRVTGGSVFTKDVVYLDGLLRVHNFMRALVSLGRTDLLPLLFVGKLDLQDLPALAALSAAGLCQPPRHLPVWISDRRFLLTRLCQSALLDRVDPARLRAHHAPWINSLPYVGVSE